MTLTVQRRRNALFLFFLLIGTSMGSWITRSPAIRDSLAVSIAEMGMVLFGLSVGSMSGILVAGWLVRRFGTRHVTYVGMLSIVVGLLLMAAGAGTGLPWVVGVGLAWIGAGMGLSEIAINVDGAHVEAQLGKPVLHALHGCFSLGAAFGALLGMGLTALQTPVHWHLAAVAVLCVPVVLWAIRDVPDGYARDFPGDPGTSAATLQEAAVPVWRDMRLLLIGFVVLAMAFAEGSANDWLTLLMVDEHGFDQAVGSLIFFAFALAMTVGRFGGGYFLARYGRAAVMRASALFGVLGLLIIIFSNSQVLAGSAVILWGLGAALGFPVALSAAADSGPNPAARVRVAATAGYVAFLVGPPMLGLVGEAVGLRSAMLVVLVLVALAGVVAGATAPVKTPGVAPAQGDGVGHA